MRYDLHIPINPVSVNKMHIANRGNQHTLTKEYRKARDAALLLLATPSHKEAVKATTDKPDGKYGLIIRYSKHGSADYSNFCKCIEDWLCKAGLTPDDKYAIFSPIVSGFGAPKDGVDVTILYGYDAEKLLNAIVTY